MGDLPVGNQISPWFLLLPLLAYTPLNLPPPMVEPLLCGIVLGLVPITIFGLFLSAYNQYRRQGGTFGG